MRILSVLALLAACGACAACGDRTPRYRNREPPFSLPLPSGYTAGQPLTNAAGQTRVTLSGGGQGPDITVSFRHAPPRDLLVTWRQVQQLELRAAKLAAHEEKDGRVLLVFKSEPDHWQVRSAIAVGDWLIDCAVDGDGKPSGPDPRTACAGLAATK